MIVFVDTKKYIFIKESIPDKILEKYQTKKTMGNSINSVTISGRIGRTPEIRYFDSGSCKATIPVAISNRVKNNGDWEDATIWIECQFWGKKAEFLTNYGKKGDMVVLQGKLAVDNWEKDGETKYKTYIQGIEIQLLGSSKDNSDKEKNFGTDLTNTEDFTGTPPF